MANETKHNDSIIIGRCTCDDTVKYPFYWCEELIEEANNIGFDVIDLKNENFIEKKFSSLVETQTPRFIFKWTWRFYFCLWI